MGDSYQLLSYKDQGQLKYVCVWKSPAVKSSTNYKKQYQTLQSLRKK